MLEGVSAQRAALDGQHYVARRSLFRMVFQMEVLDIGLVER